MYLALGAKLSETIALKVNRYASAKKLTSSDSMEKLLKQEPDNTFNSREFKFHPDFLTEVVRCLSRRVPIKIALAKKDDPFEMHNRLSLFGSKG